MKGQMELEYPFKIFLYVVVILVVIGLIVTFRNQILTYLKLCQYTPQGCSEQERCTTISSKETTITATELKKYCDRCWDRTGRKEYKDDCLCYVVTGSYSPTAFTDENCELKCDNADATSLLFSYDGLLQKIYIKC